MIHPNVLANQNAELTPQDEVWSQNLNERPMVIRGTIGWRTRTSMGTFFLVIGGVLCCCDGGADHMRGGTASVSEPPLSPDSSGCKSMS